MHEHLDAFNIVNMNGRVYDPLTAQFFSPDPHIQSPGNWLNYNRYSYVLNNPFKYTDPSGEIFAQIAGYLIYTGLSYASAAKANNWNWDYRTWQNNSVVVGYSVYGGGFFVGFTFDGNRYANIGANYNGLTVGSTNNGETRMEGIGQRAIQIAKNATQASKNWIRDQYDYFTDWDAKRRDLTDWDAWENAIPVWGSCKQSGEALDRGDYWGAVISFGVGSVEAFSLGFGSQLAVSAKATMSSSLPRRQIVNYAGDGIEAVAKETAKTGGRAFFSGAGTEAKAIQQGYQTLGQTRAGQNLQNLITSKNIPWKGPGGAESMWHRLSATWAKGIPDGSSVPVFLNNPRAGSIWFQTELPILKSKGVNLIYK